MRYLIDAGRRCWVRQQGKTEWVRYITTKILTFDKCELADKGGSRVFTSGEWQIKVAACFVEEVKSDILAHCPF